MRYWWLRKVHSRRTWAVPNLQWRWSHWPGLADKEQGTVRRKQNRCSQSVEGSPELSSFLMPHVLIVLGMMAHNCASQHTSQPLILHPDSILCSLPHEDHSRCPLRSLPLLLALGSNNSLRVSLWSFMLPTYDSCQPTFCALFIITTGSPALQSYLFCCSLYILQLSFQENKNFSVTITM